MGVDLGPHMSDDQIERYSMGAVSEAELEPVEEHLLICEACQNRVTENDLYVAAMQGAGNELRHEPAKRRWDFVFFRLAPMAAAAALLVVVAIEAPRLANHARMPAAITLEALRGTSMAKAPAAEPLVLRLDVAGLAEQKKYRVEAVDAAGNPVWTGEAPVQGMQAAANLPALGPGLYFVRLYDNSGKVLREFGVETTHPESAR